MFIWQYNNNHQPLQTSNIKLNLELNYFNKINTTFIFYKYSRHIRRRRHTSHIRVSIGFLHFSLSGLQRPQNKFSYACLL